MRRSDDEDALTLIQLPRLGACPLALGSVRLAEALATREPPSVAGALPDASVFLTRIEVQVDGVLEAAHWLSHQHVYPRVYFSDQHKSLRIAGVGAAEELRSSGALDDAALATTLRRLGKCERMRFYGGMRFDNTNGPLQDEWASYGGSVFILPLWELQVSTRHVRGLWDVAMCGCEESTRACWSRHGQRHPTACWMHASAHLEPPCCCAT